MRTAFAILASAALATAHGVSTAVAPSASPPPGCSPNYDGTFNISPVNVSSHAKRDTPLGITLKNGILTDSQGRTGYIASNSQFQFDNPPQAGAIYTAGFTVCQNSRLTLGNDQTWYKCKSGDFFNIYFKNVLSAGQCIESYIDTVPVGSGGPAPVPASFSTVTYAHTTAASNSSSSGLVSSSTAAANGTAAHNGTASASSASVSSSFVPKTTKTKNGHTVVVPGHKTTVKATQTTAKGGKATGAKSAAASSSSGGAAGEAVSVGGEMLGLAAGILAFAMF